MLEILIILSCLFSYLYSIRGVEDVSEFLVFNSLIISRCSTSSSSLHTGAISLGLAIFSTVVSLSGPITHRFFPRIFPGSFNLFPEIINSFQLWRKYEFHQSYSFFKIASNLFSSLDQPFILLYSGVSQLFLVLFLVIILSLQIRRSVSLSLVPFLWRLSSQLRVSSHLLSIMSNPFRAIRCISELFLFLVPPKAIILEDSSFSAFSFHPQFFSIVVSSFVSQLFWCLVLVFFQVDLDLFILMYLQ